VEWLTSAQSASAAGELESGAASGVSEGEAESRSEPVSGGLLGAAESGGVDPASVSTEAESSGEVPESLALSAD
jgi:hypothetical protein